jgi:hypothetical protein
LLVDDEYDNSSIFTIGLEDARFEVMPTMMPKVNGEGEKVQCSSN